jgi:DNA-binding GntR family transcriptional regulator
VEAAALRVAIAGGDRHWEAQIVAAAYRLRNCPKNDGEKLSDEWYCDNRAFHDALVGACNSRQTMVFRSQLYDLSDRYRRLSVHSGLAGRDFDAEHQRIMDAVLARDADAAVTATIDHFVETSRVILSEQMNDDAEVARVIDVLCTEIRAGAGLARAAAAPARRQR